MGVRTQRARAGVLAAAVVCIVAVYWPFLSLPFISDDYVQLQLGRTYGSAAGWKSLLGDALYRCRATSILLTHWTEELFGLEHSAYAWTGLVVHIVNTCLVFALGGWRVIGYRVSALTALLFAVYEVHQEAVVWYAALPELLVFTFSLSSVLCFIHAQQSQARRGGRLWFAASIGFFVLALFSKESAVVVAPLSVLVLWTRGDLRTRWPWLLPHALLAAIYTGFVFAASASHLHFNDAGTFSLRAPFGMVLARSAGRALWIWGALAIAALAIWGRRRTRFQATVGLAWIGIALLPYSFLTYMPRVPSRHLYLASVGVALLLASALLLRPWSRRGRMVAISLVVAFVLQNAIYLRTRKWRQFNERAQITENLVRTAGTSGSPLYVSCFPYSPVVAELALEIRYGRDVVMVMEQGTRPNGLNVCSEAHVAHATKGQTIRLDW